MKYLILSIILLVSFPKIASSQLAVTNDVVENLKKIPNEHVYVHTNTTLLFSGEYLYYAIYCLNTADKVLSPWSKIAYVELMSEENELIFKHKIILNNGLGKSDFFIPVSLPSGSYKLIAYTQWMQNGTTSEFYTQDIHIINPYRANELKVTSLDNKNDSTALIYTKPMKLNQRLLESNEHLSIQLQKQRFKKRSLVQMTINTTEIDAISNGYYSISVRKKGAIPYPESFGIRSYLKNINDTSTNFDPSKFYIPELRGELITGRVTNENNTPRAHIKIGISIPGKDHFFTIVKTNEEGRFFVNLKDGYTGNDIFIQVIEETKSNSKIIIDQHESPNYGNLTYRPLEIDSIFQKDILERSIHNQIENAFYAFKPDSVLATPHEGFLDSKKSQTYDLDDYTRFPTIKETVFEIIKDVSTKNLEKDESSLLVQGYNFHSSTGILPLLLVDGLIIQDHDVLLNLDSKFFQSITVYRDQFIIGPTVYQGAVFLNTKNGIPTSLKNDVLYTSPLLKPQLQKNYYNQQHIVDSRIPDDRIQLLWNPRILLTKKENFLEFYTSDIEGEYEILIEGIYNTNIPFSLTKFFRIE